MARTFNDAASQYLESTSAVLTGVPISMACWFNSDDITVSQTLMALSRSSTTNEQFDLGARGAVAGDPIRANTVNGATTGAADTTAGYSANTWQHACGVWAATNSRAAYLNGGSKGTNTTSVTPGTINTTNVGAIWAGATPARVRFMSGLIAEAAIWSAALDDDEAAALARGMSPLLVRPQSLVAYWPMVGRYSPEIDLKGGFPLTLGAAPTVGDHCRVFGPARAR